MKNENCIYKDCSKPQSHRGLCAEHFALHNMFVNKTLSWTTLELLGYTTPVEAKPFQCKQDGCTAQYHKAKGYCLQHYQQVRAKASLSETLCEVESCDRKQAMVEGKPCLFEGKRWCGRHINEELQRRAAATLAQT
jgi:hypothetical protein